MIYVRAKDDFCNCEFISEFLLLLLSGGKGEGGSGRVQSLLWEFLHFNVSCCAQPYTGGSAFPCMTGGLHCLCALGIRAVAYDYYYFI